MGRQGARKRSVSRRPGFYSRDVAYLGASLSEAGERVDFTL